MKEEEWYKRRSKHMLKRILTYYYDDEGKLMNNRPFEEHFISENPYYDNKSEIEKESAELKKKVENLQKYLDTRNCYRECAETWLKLKEAKKLLKQLLEARNSEDTYKAEWESEQFLKGR